MKKLKVKTVSTQAGRVVSVSLGTQCRRAKEFFYERHLGGRNAGQHENRRHDSYSARWGAVTCFFLCRAVWRLN